MAEESGLLGILNDPNMVGLLSAAASGMAGARRGAPWNTAGAALLGGLQGYSGAQSNLIDVAQKKAQLDWAKQIGGGMSQPSGAQSMASLSSQPSIVDSKDTPAWAQPKTAQAPTQQRSSGVSLPMLMQGAALGMKNMEPLFNMYKYANDGVERKTNTVYVNPITGEKTYIGDPTKGYNMNPNTGEVTPMDRFIDTNNAIKGGEAQAQEKAKSQYRLLDPKSFTSGGRPVPMSEYQFMNGGATQVQQSPIRSGSVPTKGTPASWDGINQNYAAGNGSRQSDQLTILNQELAAAKNPADIASLQREIARVSGNRAMPRQPATQSSGGFDSEADRAAAVKAAENTQSGRVEIGKNYAADAVKSAEAIRGQLGVFDQIEGLIKQGTLGNSPLDRGAMMLHASGVRQTPETIRTATLQKLGNQLVLSRGSLGAGVSVSDAERYDKAAGDFSTAQSNAERLKHIQTMRSIAAPIFDHANSAIEEFNRTGNIKAFELRQKQQTQKTGSAQSQSVDALLKKYGY